MCSFSMFQKFSLRKKTLALAPCIVASQVLPEGPQWAAQLQLKLCAF